jgi:4'-phosphopantetheinyl transferase
MLSNIATIVNMDMIFWKNEVPSLFIKPQDVHLWKCKFENNEEDLVQFTGMLSNAESNIATRFVYRQDRERYIYFHGALRVIMSAYTHTPPHLLSFWKNSYGKPHVVRLRGKADFKFSLSHSQNIALIAVALDQEVGVDVEFIRPMNDARDIAKSYFAFEEQQLLLPLSDEVFNDCFFICWTQKEAFTKAIGKGFSCSLDKFIVPAIKNGCKKCDIKNAFNGESEAWLFESFTPHPGYVGALVTRPYSGALSHFQFREIFEGGLTTEQFSQNLTQV